MHRLLLAGFVAALIASLSTGCNKPSPVIQYTIDHRMPPQLRGEKRLVGAMIPQEQEVWFFKILGDDAVVQGVRDEVRRWISELRFEQGRPRLDLPPQWTNRGSSSMRLATIEIPAEPLPVEMSISSLPKGDTWESLVAQNVNRWRGQVSLEPSSERFAGGEVLESSAGTAAEPAVWVDLVGTLAGSDRSIPSAADLGTAAIPASDGEGAAKPNPQSPLQYTIPDGWEEGAKGGMRLAAFSMGPADRRGELTVIIAGGDIRPNVQRWLGQIQGGTVDEATVDAAMQGAIAFRVADLPAQRFLLAGTGDRPQSIDATLVTLEPSVHLFIKLTGDAETVLSEKERVEAFLNSLKLKL